MGGGGGRAAGLFSDKILKFRFERDGRGPEKRLPEGRRRPGYGRRGVRGAGGVKACPPVSAVRRTVFFFITIKTRRTEGVFVGIFGTVFF